MPPPGASGGSAACAPRVLGLPKLLPDTCPPERAVWSPGVCCCAAAGLGHGHKPEVSVEGAPALTERLPRARTSS